MRATLIYGAGDVRVETVPTRSSSSRPMRWCAYCDACICGSDLWPYDSMEPSEDGRRIGHEFIGVVEDVGAAVCGV